VQPRAQHPSPPVHCVIVALEHWAEQLVALPVSESIVQALPSLQLAGQLPSHTSPASTCPLPQLAEQSVSLLRLQPGAQQPSPDAQAVIAEARQTELQAAGSPSKRSTVQEFPSSQAVGQLPSQVSPASTVRLPQVAEQSESSTEVHPGAQQPSPPVQAITAVNTHFVAHAPPVASRRSVVHAEPSLQLVGQLPSQSSGDSVTVLPQRGAQSASLSVEQAAGQQPSPVARQAVIGAATHFAVHSDATPTTDSG